MRTAATALALLLLVAPVRAGDGDADRSGSPAFVPLEDDAAAAALAAAERRADAAADDTALEEAARAFQAIIDGPFGGRLAPLPGVGEETLELAREGAQRRIALRPRLRAVYRRRMAALADGLEAGARNDGDLRALRELDRRFPLTDAGARASIRLARHAHRRGLHDEALGILDRLHDLHPEADPGGVPRADILALEAEAAAAAGDTDTLAAVALRAAALGPAARTSAGGGLLLADHVAGLRADAAARARPGPTGPLELLWAWRPRPWDVLDLRDDRTLVSLHQDALPRTTAHGLAVQDDLVIWSDRWRVVWIDLATGETRAQSTRPDGREPVGTARPEEPHLGETFAPAVDDRGVVVCLDHAAELPSGRRVGLLARYDRTTQRLLALRGGPADDPALARRYVFHGRPLVHGDRVYVAATETGVDLPAGAVADVRTHVLGFRRSDLALVFDTFLAYGSGRLLSSIAPAGSLAARHGRLYVATRTGLEACLDGRTGDVLWAHRYRVPRKATHARLTGTDDGFERPILWPDSPPVFSGPFVGFAPSDAAWVDLVFQRPEPRSGAVVHEVVSRPRLDRTDLTTYWVLPGPAASFFLAGRAGPDEAPLLLRSLDTLPAAAEPDGFPVLWRAAIMEPEIVGRPVRTRGAVYAVTDKALYRVPFPGRDGEVQRLAAIPSTDAEGNPLPRPGDLLVLEDRILSVSDGGILCFGRP